MSPTKEVRYTSHSVSPSPRGRSRSVSPSPRGRSRSVSPSPRRRSRSRSFSRDRSRSRSRSRERGAPNPGNNLFVTGLSTRVTSSDLEKYFSKEGKVVDCEVIRDPRTRESRGFGFVTMESLGDANRCVRYLNRSVLEGRLITVQKVWCISTELTIYALTVCTPPSRHVLCIDTSVSSIQISELQKGNVAGHQHLVNIEVQGTEEIVTGDAPAATLLMGGGTEVVLGLGTDGIDPIHHTGKMRGGGSDHCLLVAVGTDQISLQ